MVKAQTHLSIVETLAQSKLSSFMTLQGSPLGSATVGDLLVGIGVVITGWAVSRSLVWCVFALAARATDLRKRAQQVVQPVQGPDAAPERQAAIEVIDTSLEEPRSRLRVLNAFAELCCGLGVALLVAAFWGNVLDVAAGLASLGLGLVLVVAAVHLFLSEYFGPATMMAKLQGRPWPSPLSPK
ncbi:hypothetical protein [Ideonella sp. BN130291]|uniref:hypothetical protein n=1 Tax=Ideonella sp. BN130291 TaxID=3112940 RepID=UPI002E26FE31